MRFVSWLIQVSHFLKEVEVLTAPQPIDQRFEVRIVSRLPLSERAKYLKIVAVLQVGRRQGIDGVDDAQLV